MPRSQVSPSSRRKAPLPQALKKYVSGAPSQPCAQGWQGGLWLAGSWEYLLDGFGRWVHPGQFTLVFPPPVIGVTLSAFHFQDDKKKKVPSDLAKVNVVRVAREGCEHREGGGLEIGAS